jgi:hypothetical protein
MDPGKLVVPQDLQIQRVVAAEDTVFVEGDAALA